jgi:hypothetical protein
MTDWQTYQNGNAPYSNGVALAREQDTSPSDGRAGRAADRLYSRRVPTLCFRL